MLTAQMLPFQSVTKRLHVLPQGRMESYFHQVESYEIAIFLSQKWLNTSIFISLNLIHVMGKFQFLVMLLLLKDKPQDFKWFLNFSVNRKTMQNVSPHSENFFKHTLQVRWQTQGPQAKSSPPSCFIRVSTLLQPVGSAKLLSPR